MIVGVVHHVPVAELAGRLRQAAAHADALEVRLDTLSDAGSLGGAERPGGTAALPPLDALPCPVIATCRPAWEGGEFSGSETAREARLSEAAKRGAAYLDIEQRAEIRPARHGARLIVSRHWFDAFPGEAAVREAARDTPAGAIFKYTFEARDLDDVLLVATLNANLPGETTGIAMGDAGELSRILYRRLGSCLTYGPLPGEPAVAPGQVPVDLLRRRYRASGITGATALFGVLGNPVAQSRGVRRHNAAFRALGLDAVYLPLCATDLGAFWRLARALPLAGFSVTSPFKTGVIAGLDVVDAVAQRIGAVNTVIDEPAGWRGVNLDLPAAFAALGAVLPVGALAEKPVLVLGAGGAARMLIVGLLDAGARVTVANRTAARAEALARDFGVDGCAWESLSAPRTPGFALVVNATTAGMAPRPEAQPVDLARLPLAAGAVVYDLIYEPAPTRLLRAARALGYEALDGRAMYEDQAARQFALWTGSAFPKDLAPTAEV